MMNRREQIADKIQYAYGDCCANQSPDCSSKAHRNCALGVADLILALGLDSCPHRGERQKQPKRGEPICRIKLTSYVQEYMPCSDDGMRGCKTFQRINAAIKGEG